MTKDELKNKAVDIFNKYYNETILYCIDDGNFWLEKDKKSAQLYSFKLKKELIEMQKMTPKEITDEEARLETEAKAKIEADAKELELKKSVIKKKPRKYKRKTSKKITDKKLS